MGIVPKALQNRPVLREDCRQYLEAFYVLDWSRPTVMEGYPSIPLQDIKAYMDISLIPYGEDALKFLRLIQALDQTKSNHWHKRVSK